jgi:predicted transcriptional regulator
MRNVTVNTGSIENYFTEIRSIAKKIDCNKPILPEFTLTFEDPGDMFAVMTPVRLALFRAAKAELSSISVLAQRLGRDRSTVKKDVDVLVAAGLLDIEEVPLPGHGRQKFVKVMADRIQLHAVVM